MTRRPFPHGCLRTFLHRHRQSMPSNWVLTLSAYERNVLFYARKILFSDFSHTHSHAFALAACRFCLICYFWVLPINRCKTLLWIIPFDCLFVEFRTVQQRRKLEVTIQIHFHFQSICWDSGGLRIHICAFCLSTLYAHGIIQSKNARTFGDDRPFSKEFRFGRGSQFEGKIIIDACAVPRLESI